MHAQGNLKRRVAENAEEMLALNLCVLCDSAFLFKKSAAGRCLESCGNKQESLLIKYLET